MTLSRFSCLPLCAVLALAACGTPTERPDYAIRVTPTDQGGLAQAPACPSYVSENANLFDNQPMPQFGCATSRNLALQVEHPNDLVAPGAMGPMRGTEAVGAIRRYDNNQTRGLVLPGEEVNQLAVTTAPTAASSMTGDMTGAASASSGGTAPAATAAP